MTEVSNDPYTTELRVYEKTTPLGETLRTEVNISCNDFETFCRIVTAVNSILTGEDDKRDSEKYCIDCIHCIGEPACCDAGGIGFTKLYSCMHKYGRKKMFPSNAEICEYFEAES